MLNLRSGLVLTAAALCLWALYSLLSSLKAPGLLRSEKAAVLKGCEELDDADIRRTCIPLLCEKALIDAKLVPWNARFEVHTNRVSPADIDFDVVGGTVDATNKPGMNSFGCLLERNRVTLRDVFDNEALQAFISDADEDPEHMSGT